MPVAGFFNGKTGKSVPLSALSGGNNSAMLLLASDGYSGRSMHTLREIFGVKNGT
jgi:hypothetical protein